MKKLGDLALENLVDMIGGQWALHSVEINFSLIFPLPKNR